MPDWILYLTAFFVAIWLIILGLIPTTYAVCWGIVLCIWIGDLLKGKDEEE